MPSQIVDFWEDWKEVIILLGVLLVILFCCGSFVTVGESLSCHGKARDLDLNSRWLLIGGCQVEVEPGRWIPLENYRWMEAK